MTLCSMPTSQTGAQRAPSLPPIPQAALKHLERPRSYLGMSLIDFYSVFNTIQHHLMMQKLMRMYRSVNTPSLLRMYRSVNTQSLLKKGTQRLHCVKKLKWFSICPKLLELLYRATVESTVAFNSPSFSGGQREGAQLGYALQDHQYS